MRILMMLTGATLLAACGGDEKEVATIDVGDGQTATVTTRDDGETATITSTGKGGATATQIFGAGANWPADAPAYAPAYPGGAITGAFSGASGDGAGAMVSFTTGDAPAKVVDFYAARAKAAGLGDVTTMNTNDARIFGAADKASGRSLSVQASVQDGKTQAAVMYGTSKG